MTWLWRLGFGSIAVALLLPLCLFLVPRLLVARQMALYPPRRYHYYYFAPEATTEFSNRTAFALSGFFFVMGVGLLSSGRRKGKSDLPAD